MVRATSTKRDKVKWSQEEKDAIHRQLKSWFKGPNPKPPGRLACLACKQKEPALENRDWKAIKFAVYNEIVTQKRREKKLFKM
jgi:hypothetical protein